MKRQLAKTRPTYYCEFTNFRHLDTAKFLKTFSMCHDKFIAQDTTRNYRAPIVVKKSYIIFAGYV